MSCAATSKHLSKIPDQYTVNRKTYFHQIEGNAAQTANYARAMLEFQSIAKDGTMLILTRRSNETIKIGDDIKVTVLEIKGSQVRLGLEAPDDVVILRAELLEVE